MHRRFSSLVRKSSAGPSSQVAEEASIFEDNESKITAVAKDEHLPVPALKVKRVDYYYSWWTKSWKYRNTSANVTIETIPIIGGGTNDIWKDFTFVIVRTVSKQENIDPSFKVVIKSGYLLKACKDVIKSWPGISWNNDPLELDPEIFIAYYPSFLQYAADLKAKTSRSTEENHVLASVNVLTSTIASDFRITLNKIDHLTSHGEITFDLLYAILVPRSVMVGRCSITGLIRLFQLASWTRTAVEGKAVFQLNLESIDLVDRPITQSVVVGRVQTTVHIRVMKGTFKIDSLDAYPLQFHPDPKGLEDMIRKRSKKWVSLIGTHHMEYDGLAAIKNGEILVKHNIRSRIMVDRAAFRRLNQNHILPIPVPPKADDVAGGANDPRFHLAAGSGVGDPRLYRPEYDEFGNYIPPPLVAAPSDTLAQQSINATPDVEISDEDLLLAPATVFGFSLSDKVWLQFNVEKIQDVDWNTDAFANLVLPGERKHLLQSLVEAHHKEIGFDDFIKDKGQGLVVNLFGPPGVGKTFSVTIHVTRSSRYPSSTFFLFFTFVHFVSRFVFCIYLRTRSYISSFLASVGPALRVLSSTLTLGQKSQNTTKKIFAQCKLMDGEQQQQQQLPQGPPSAAAPPPDPQPPAADALATFVVTEMRRQFGAQFAELRADLDDSLRRVAGLEAELIKTQALVARGASRAPRVAPPTPFDPKLPNSKELADQWVRQISNAALFEVFASDEHKILWAESYLAGQANTWSSTITTTGTRETNAARYSWAAWLQLFKEVFCTRDAPADALRRLSVLVQGSKSITQYCTEFKELSLRLSVEDQRGDFVKERFWQGLSTSAKKALVNSDYRTVEEAQDILLRREMRLADIEAAERQMKQVGSHSGTASGKSTSSVPARPSGSVSTPFPGAQLSNPPASKDPNAMDIDAAKRGGRQGKPRTCFGCGEEGHMVFNCPKAMASLKAAVVTEILAQQASAASKSTDGSGFV